MKVSTEDLTDYIDGTLDGARLAAVEEHLRTHAEDAEMIAAMKLSHEALTSWDEDEPVHVSPDFWIKVRDQLPAEPERSWFRRTAQQLGAALWPAHSPLRRSLHAGLVAAAIALAALFFAPQQDQRNAVANDDTAFIQQSLDRHAAYVSSQPLGGSVQLGDVRSMEHGADDEGGHDTGP